MEPTEALYDQASTIFSPDGRLFQVEYARGAIEKGETIIGIQSKEGVVLIAHKHATSHLVELHLIDKIVQIDEHIGCATTGLVADAQHLVEIARTEAQIHSITYNERIPIKTLVESICDYKQLFTQFEGVRPFGVALMIAGVDETGKRLFATDPSGAYMEYKAVSEGKGSTNAISYINHVYKEDISLDKAIELGLQALSKGTKKKLNPDAIEIAIIDAKKQKFHKLSFQEVKKRVTKY